MPPIKIQIKFMITNKQPPEFPSSLTRLPKGHSAKIANFKVCNANGMPIIVIINSRLATKYSIAISKPPNNSQIIFPKNFIIIIVIELMNAKIIIFYY